MFKFQVNIDNKEFPNIQYIENRWSQFLASDKYNPLVFDFTSEYFSYYSHNIIPKHFAKDNKTIVLIFGNPAPHSVAEGLPFASEGQGKVHRMWKFLEKHNVISSGVQDIQNAVYENTDDIYYNLVIYSYFSIPSSPSDIKWSGVAGIKKLFGRYNWDYYKGFEKQRFIDFCKLLPEDSKFIVFQKDSYDEMVPIVDSRFLCKMPPTRLLYSKQTSEIFQSIL